jgi:hypothetical protein
MLTFERLAYFVTGVRCEASPRGITIRVVLGILATSAFVGFSLVFAGAGAGNSNSVGSFMTLLLPAALVYLVYLVATLVFFGKSWQQTAQYVAWSPFLLLAVSLVLVFLLSLGRT